MTRTTLCSQPTARTAPRGLLGTKNIFFDEPKILHETILGLAEFSAWAIKNFRLFLVKEGGKERAGAGRRRKFCAPLGWRGVLKGDSRENFWGGFLATILKLFLQHKPFVGLVH